jgi:hypothetical protein
VTHLDCILCEKPSTLFFTDKKSQAIYWHCANCDLKFLDPNCRLNPKDEKAHYLSHNNNVHDPEYRNFVKPICDEIQKLFRPGETGLDFGCGSGPVVSTILTELGYHIDVFDPYFYNNENLRPNYRFIAASEVAEHFYDPKKEFAWLRSRLNDAGLLAIMTHMVESTHDFANWYYRRDPTHVCFYSQKTFRWIAKEYNFKSVEFVRDRMVLLAV